MNVAAAGVGARSKLASLEGLRGILALTVCAGHLGLNTLGAKYGWSVKFDLAVDVFFAISGFVLARAYYLGRRSFRDLLVSRVARLYPLHLATMLWCLWLSFPAGFDAALFWQNLVLAHNLGLPPNRWAFNFPSWSISVEMAVSLSFFVIMLRDRSYLAPALLLAGLLLEAIAIASGMTPALNHLGIFNSGLVRGVGGFCLGSSAYLLTLKAPGVCARFGRFGGLAVAALVPFFVLQSWSLAIAALFALTVFFSVLACGSHGGMPLLSSRPFVWLGEVSYSVYLLHIPIYWTATSVLGPRVYGAGKIALIAAVLLAAHVSYRLLELPAQRLILSLCAGWRRSTA